MPRFLVERTFPDGLGIGANDAGRVKCQQIVQGNTQYGVTWVHSYVRDDDSMTYCICDGPDPESIRLAADTNEWPIDRITRVRVLTPYFHSD